MSSTMTRLEMPGLPTWPTLLFDPQNHCAIVKARFATWRSYEWAIKATQVLSVGLFLWLSEQWWIFLGDSSEKWIAFLYGELALVMIVGGSHHWIDSATRGFFARQVFAKRMTVWFTPEVIGFRSGLYCNGVRLSRAWCGMRVTSRFDVAKDHVAMHRQQSAKPEKKGDTMHLELAQTIRLLVSTVEPNNPLSKSSGSGSVRAIAMTEISLLDAERMTVVLAAAESLTSQQPRDQDAATNTGIDIDTSSNP